jgi:predicted NUDIX family NTP pyrophosphohydrolase
MTRSAGILLYRKRPAGDGAVEVFLVHPGGPYFAKKDLGAWTIPKGLCEPGEDELACAQRELTEETGVIARGSFASLGEATQKSGKIVVAWAVEQDSDPAALRSNFFSMEWPPRSGQKAQFPEVDRGAWFGLAEARDKILAAQAVFLDRLCVLVGGG